MLAVINKFQNFYRLSVAYLYKNNPIKMFLNTIITNYDENASILLSTHLITDVENILDQVIFLKNGDIVRYSTVDEIRSEEGKSVDSLFREVFRC